MEFPDVILICHACGARMRKIEEIIESEEGPRIHSYQCTMEDCQRKQALVYEAAVMGEDRVSWVEREVARTGAYFPSDYGRGGPRGGLR